MKATTVLVILAMLFACKVCSFTTGKNSNSGGSYSNTNNSSGGGSGGSGPATGGLASAFPKQIGRFTLDSGPKSYSYSGWAAGSQDAQEATYKSSDGTNVALTMVKFASASQARDNYQKYLAFYTKDPGYKVAGQSPIKNSKGEETGVLSLINWKNAGGGRQETVVWANGGTFMTAMSKAGAATEFVKASNF
jgi:hypothetical protein